MTMTGKITPMPAIDARLMSWVKSAPVKELARSLDIAPRVVEGWRKGQTRPSIVHLAAMIALWGDAFVQDVFAPVLPTEYDLDRRLDRVHAEIDAIRREYRHEASRQMDVRSPGRMGGAVREAVRSAGVIMLIALVGLASLHTEKRPDARTYRGPVRREEVSL